MYSDGVKSWPNFQREGLCAINWKIIAKFEVQKMYLNYFCQNINCTEPEKYDYVGLDLPRSLYITAEIILLVFPRSPPPPPPECEQLSINTYGGFFWEFNQRSAVVI